MKKSYEPPKMILKKFRVTDRISQLTMSENYGGAVQNSFNDNGILISTKLKSLK